MPTTSLSGELLHSLPTPYREDALKFKDPTTGKDVTVHPTADFLQAFEKVLLGIDDQQKLSEDPFLGIEQMVDKIASYFVPLDPNPPEQTPEEFLPWLAGWLAFTIRADLPQAARREFIRNLATLYRWRGTEENLKRVLEYFTGLPSTDSTVTISDSPHCFEVRVDLHSLISDQQYGDVHRLVEIAHALIRREKPAHTRYILAPIFRSFQIGELNKDGTIKTAVLNPDGTIKSGFLALVHGYKPDPDDPNKTKEVGNTLLGINIWE